MILPEDVETFVEPQLHDLTTIIGVGSDLIDDLLTIRLLNLLKLIQRKDGVTECRILRGLETNKSKF